MLLFSSPDPNDHGISPALFPFFIIGLMLLVSFFISFFGGWWATAKDHPFQASETGTLLKKYYFCSMNFGYMGKYQNATTITLFENGIKLQPTFIFFPFFHKSIFLKWSDIRVIDNAAVWGLITCKRVILGSYGINFYRSSAKGIEEYYLKHLENSKVGSIKHT